MQQRTDARPGLNTSRSERLHASAVAVLPGGTSRTVHQTPPHPIYVREGAGCAVIDVDGNEYVDFYNNASSLVHGHAHPAVVAALETQARRGTAFSLPVEEQIELGRVLTERIASADQVRFVNSGTEAVLLAVKAVRALTGRPLIAKFEGLYHGSADAVEVSLDPDPTVWGPSDAPASVAYTPGTPEGVLQSVVVLPFNDIATAETLLRTHARHLAGVVLDVMPMRLGFTAAKQDWLRAIRRLTGELGILLVSDEVVTFRLDHGGAQAAFAFDADLTVLGKTIGGGLPVGALAGPRDVMRAFDGSEGRAAVPNAGTFNANPLTLAAGIAALEGLPSDAVDRINMLGADLRRRAEEAFVRLGAAAHVTGRGSLFGIHLTEIRFHDYRQYWHARVANPRIRIRQRALFEGLLQRGVLISPDGVGAISTAMGGGEIDRFLAALVETLETLDD